MGGGATSSRSPGSPVALGSCRRLFDRRAKPIATHCGACAAADDAGDRVSGRWVGRCFRALHGRVPHPRLITRPTSTQANWPLPNLKLSCARPPKDPFAVPGARIASLIPKLTPQECANYFLTGICFSLCVGYPWIVASLPVSRSMYTNAAPSIR